MGWLLFAAVTVSMTVGWLLGSRFSVSLGSSLITTVARCNVHSEQTISVSERGITFENIYQVGDEALKLTKTLDPQEADWLVERWQKRREEA
jgi:hypothetical protein